MIPIEDKDPIEKLGIQKGSDNYKAIQSMLDKAREDERAKKPKEYILCAAIHYLDGKKYVHQPKNITSGYVWCGRRHHNIINLRGSLIDQPTRREISEQGFITNLDRFVTRKEGNMIAIAAGQVIGNTEGDELISEDLY